MPHPGAWAGILCGKVKHCLADILFPYTLRSAVPESRAVSHSGMRYARILPPFNPLIINMEEAMTGEIRLFAGTFAPLGWAFCDGSLLPIAEYDALFSLLGTRFGGDGHTTFGLPDLRSRVAVHAGASAGPGLPEVGLGQQFGSDIHRLTVEEMPAHTHQLKIHAAATTTQANRDTPNNTISAIDNGQPSYLKGSPNVVMSPMSVGVTISPAGGDVPFDHRQPGLGLQYVIALYGAYYPQRP
jgi:microcystin-dependent protein